MNNSINNLTVFHNFGSSLTGGLYQLPIYEHIVGDELKIDTNPKDAINLIKSYSDYGLYTKLEKIIDKYNIKSLIINEALENIRDIRPLLSCARYLLQNKDTKVRVVFKSKDTGTLRRYWNNNEASKMLTDSGFVITDIDTKKRAYSLGSDFDNYNKFLESKDMPALGFEHLMVTTEHSDYRITGGIGSYVKECEKLYGNKSTVLIIDNNLDLDINKITANRWFSAQTLIGANRYTIIDNSNLDMISGVVYETILQILFYYPTLKYIEAQEILLDRAIQAKRAGIIDNKTILITTCHGASFHLARAKKDMLELEQIHVAYREKRTIESSDVTIFPTKFLKESYKKVGIEGLDNHAKLVKRLPFEIERLPTGKKLVAYKNIIYIGKTSSIKGFDIFLESLIALSKLHPDITSDIENVICIVTSTEINEKPIAKLLVDAKLTFNINLISLAREDLLKYLSESAQDSLALITYPGDNHPTVILELMAIGHDFLALDCGGTPELIPKGYNENYIVENSIVSICNKIKYCFDNVGSRVKTINSVSLAYIEEQRIINKNYTTSYFNEFSKQENVNDVNPLVLIKIIGDFKSAEYQKTLRSIKNQNYKNIIIDRQNSNQQAEFVIRLYEGDQIDSDYVEQLVNNLRYDSLSAVLCNVVVPVYENYKLKTIEEFSPVNPQLGSVFLQEKYKRRVVGIFRLVDLPSDYENYSDWHLVIYLASHDKNINIVPELLAYLARNDELINWDEQLEQDTMSRLIKEISHFDSYILYSQLKRLDNMYFGSRLYNHLEDIYIRRDDPTIMLGVTPNTVKAIGAYRRYMPKTAHKLLLHSAKKARRAGNKIKRIYPS